MEGLCGSEVPGQDQCPNPDWTESDSLNFCHQLCELQAIISWSNRKFNGPPCWPIKKISTKCGAQLNRQRIIPNH